MRHKLWAVNSRKPNIQNDRRKTVNWSHLKANNETVNTFLQWDERFPVSKMRRTYWTELNQHATLDSLCTKVSNITTLTDAALSPLLIACVCAGTVCKLLAEVTVTLHCLRCLSASRRRSTPVCCELWPRHTFHYFIFSWLLMLNLNYNLNKAVLKHCTCLYLST